MKEFHILNLGAGVQSTALYLMFMREQIRERQILTANRDGSAIQTVYHEPIKLDCAIFADTQDEPAAVYRHLEWLQSLGGPPILVRTKGKISSDLLKSTGRFASIPAYTLRPDGTEGKTRRHCSTEYKIAVIEQTIRREVCGAEAGRSPRGVKVHQYIVRSMKSLAQGARLRDAAGKQED